MPHSGIFAFFYIAGKEEWQFMQELIEHRDSINRQLALHCVPMTDAVQRKAKALLKEAVPMKQIQEWLGHSDIFTTANIYAHLDS